MSARRGIKEGVPFIVMKLPDVREKYAGLGVATVHTTPQRVLELVRIESPKMGKVLKAAGVEPD